MGRKKPYSCIAFGLGFHSDLPITEMDQIETESDVKIRFGRIECPLPLDNNAQHSSRVIDQEVYLSWKSVGRFLVRGGSEIIVDPDPEVLSDRLRLFLLGPVMGVLLHQRRYLVLHASAVSINGGAVLFLGCKRCGKSTIAAILHARGHELIADDLVAIRVIRGQQLVLPGFPQLRLWPDSVSAIGLCPESLPRLHPELEKRDYRVTSRFSSKPLPPSSVYVIDEGAKPIVEALDAQNALLQLIAHWYCARFGFDTLQALGISSHFLQAANVINGTPVHVLRRPRSLSAMSEVADLVEARFTLALEKDTPDSSRV
jgi:HPr Serine kinase C-terminal domain